MGERGFALCCDWIFSCGRNVLPCFRIPNKVLYRKIADDYPTTRREKSTVSAKTGSSFRISPSAAGLTPVEPQLAATLKLRSIRFELSVGLVPAKTRRGGRVQKRCFRPDGPDGERSVAICVAANCGPAGMKPTETFSFLRIGASQSFGWSPPSRPEPICLGL